MPWTVGWRIEPESDLIAEILLAVGKALYIANRFEANCKTVLKAAHFVDIITDDPAVTLAEIAGRMPADKMLGPTLGDLFAHAGIRVKPQQAEALTKAKTARNWLAHKGAAELGDLHSYNVPKMLTALRTLRNMVADLAAGDNIASAWVYTIEEPGEPLPPITRQYSERVDDWVFGHLPANWLDPSWQPPYEQPRTVRDSIERVRSYEPFYSRKRDGCLHDPVEAIRRRADIERSIAPRKSASATE
jgi:hypothetical protein